MNEEYYKWVMRRIDTITTDELRMIAIMEGLQWTPYKLNESRNSREGRYAGFCRYIGHIRVGNSGEMKFTKRIRVICAQHIAYVRLFGRGGTFYLKEHKGSW